MQVEHDGLASHLVLPRITFPASDTMPEQIADPVEHRSSMIALRRRGGEALWASQSEEGRPAVIFDNDTLSG
jgi:hypothetical protein